MPSEPPQGVSWSELHPRATSDERPACRVSSKLPVNAALRDPSLSSAPSTASSGLPLRAVVSEPPPRTVLSKLLSHAATSGPLLRAARERPLLPCGRLSRSMVEAWLCESWQSLPSRAQPLPSVSASMCFVPPSELATLASRLPPLSLPGSTHGIKLSSRAALSELPPRVAPREQPLRAASSELSPRTVSRASSHRASSGVS